MVTDAPRIRTVTHGAFHPIEEPISIGAGRPMVGIDRRGNDIHKVELLWGRTNWEYSGYFIAEGTETEATPFAQDGAYKSYVSRFGLTPFEDLPDPPYPTLSVDHGDRFDYSFKVTYTPPGTGDEAVLRTPNQHAYVRPENATMSSAIYPTAQLQVGQDRELRIHITQSDLFSIPVTLTADPPGSIQFVDSSAGATEGSDQLKITIPLGYDYYELTIRAVEVTYSSKVTITGKANGWTRGSIAVGVTSPSQG
jgi:hypothetical protein